MAKLIRRFLEAILGRKWQVVRRLSDVDEIPNVLGPRDIVLVATPDFVKWIVFDCPCRTGHRIMLNADNARSPYWELQSENPTAIYPSVDFRPPHRRCHYVISSGRTYWTKDSD